MSQDDGIDRDGSSGDKTARPVEGRLQLPRSLAVVGALAAIAGFGVTATYYVLTYAKTSAKFDHDEEVRLSRAKIYFEMRLSREWCKVKRDGTYSQCGAKILATDASKKILNFGIQLPSSIESRNGMHSTFGSGTIDFGSFNPAITTRTLNSFGIDRASRIRAILPIVIYSTYEFEGEQYKDRSVYHVYYQTIGTVKQVYALPVGMVYCGRLRHDDPAIDFLLDPWARSPIGYERSASKGLMFNCPAESAFWFSLPSGRGFVQTDISPGQEHAPKTTGDSYQIAFRKFRVIPVDTRLNLTYWMSDLDDPSLPQLPQVR